LYQILEPFEHLGHMFKAAPGALGALRKTGLYDLSIPPAHENLSFTGKFA
jgi:hypothetical protein